MEKGNTMTSTQSLRVRLTKRISMLQVFKESPKEKARKEVPDLPTGDYRNSVNAIHEAQFQGGSPNLSKREDDMPNEVDDLKNLLAAVEAKPSPPKMRRTKSVATMRGKPKEEVENLLMERLNCLIDDPLIDTAMRSNIQNVLNQRRNMMLRSMSQSVLFSKQRESTKRENIINEFVSTEAAYLLNLVVLYEVFKKPMVELELLSQKEAATIFMNLEEIIEVNMKFYCELTSSKHLTPSILSKYLNIYWVRAYAKYFRGYSAAIKAFSAISSKTMIKRFLDDTRKDKRTHSKCIDDFLITPIQRMPRYKLLLEDLLKDSKPDTCAHNDVKTALQNLMCVNDILNVIP